MSQVFDGVFLGNSESECIDFICAVRQHAKDNGKTQDDVWIANELYNAFRGKALKWYLRLPVNVRRDWEQLQQVLLTRWTTDDEDDDIRTSVSSFTILSTPAVASAAPPLNAASSRIIPRDPWVGKVGRVRARANGTTEVRYICKDCWKGGCFSGAFFSTADPTKALKVRLIATAPDFYRLELMEHESGLSVLAAFNRDSDDWKNYWGHLVGVDAPGQGPLEDRRNTFNGGHDCTKRQSWTDKWQLGDNGVLTLCGPGNTAEAARFNLDKAGATQDGLWFAGPRVNFGSAYVVAILEFDPLET